MTKKRTLAIMAAGLGSRFGSLKQLYAINNNNNSIMDYSIFDAISIGFNSIVIIVSSQTLSVFQERYLGKLPQNISLEFVVQHSPELILKYPKRQKPYGTGHALLKLKNHIEGNFALINADDFYGRATFKLMYTNLFNATAQKNYCIGYKLKKTLSKNGYVSRGEFFLDSENNLRDVIERTHIYQKDKTLYYKVESNTEIKISEDTIVSMNFWGFTPKIFDIAENEFIAFLENHGNDNTKEFYITTIVNTCINNTSQYFNVLLTDSQWFGITYNEDALEVKNAIRTLTKNTIYPEQLW